MKSDYLKMMKARKSAGLNPTEPFEPQKSELKSMFKCVLAGKNADLTDGEPDICDEDLKWAKHKDNPNTMIGEYNGGYWMRTPHKTAIIMDIRMDLPGASWFVHGDDNQPENQQPNPNGMKKYPLSNLFWMAQECPTPMEF